MVWVGLCFSFNIPGAPDCQAQLAFVLDLKPLGTDLKPLGTRGLGLKYDLTDKETIHYTTAATLKTFNRQMVYYIIYNYDFSNIYELTEITPFSLISLKFLFFHIDKQSI